MALTLNKRLEPQHILSVYIGRFQPFHRGHLETLRQALLNAGHVLLVIGSAWHARTLRNPFLTREIERMIRACLTDEENSRLSIRGVADTYNETSWIASIHGAAASVIAEAGLVVGDESDICLVGHYKDETSEYLGLFPRWSFEDALNYQGLNATDVRAAWLADKHADLSSTVPSGTRKVVDEVGASPVYDWLLSELANKVASSEANGRMPFIYTCDGVVMQAGYVMLVTREKSPGKGLLSLPGGFLKPAETSRQTLIWNLVADHGLMMVPGRSRPEAAMLLDGRVTAMELFDSPWRSDRGRAVSCAFLINLPAPEDGKLASLRKGPLGRADWYSMAGLDKLGENILDDHAHIIRQLSSQSR